jgi:hypothetical protein
MYDMAHGMVPTHEIFREPFQVNIQLQDEPTPDSYRPWPGGDQLGKTMKMWKVQTRKFPDIDPGLVSDPYGFADSPDAEVISSGLNSKGPEAVAIGRHGNFFLWGFSAQPSDMTPEARKCFLNSICYIHKYDGQKPLVTKTSSGRGWALVYAGYMKTYPNEKFVEGMFPEDLRKRFGKDAQKYIDYYQTNLEYLHLVNRHFVVDEDVKSLGLSNRKVELLERCISLLEKGEQRDLAMRVLKRYTRESFADAAEWRAWLTKNREQLFFTDTGGYKFLVDPGAGTKPAATAAATPGQR